MQYTKFKNILNKKIFEDSKADLIKKIADTPDRYTGLFRPTKPKAKILQNLLQSHEIRFGDALEELFREYFSDLGYTNLDRILILPQNNSIHNYLSLDQLFKQNRIIYFVEQKVRDDHDSTKKKGQMSNFEEKIMALLEKYPNTIIKAYTYFIDDSLKKNKNFYEGKIASISEDYNVYCKLCYGKEFWQDIGHLEIWEEILSYLTIWKEEIPDMPSINFDEDADNSFYEIKDLRPLVFRKIFYNKEVCNIILPILFPDNLVLNRLVEYYSAKTESIYKRIADLIREYISNN